MKTDTDVKNNMIAHYCDPAENSDKIYITCVRKNKNGEWEFVGKWGKRGSKLKEMIYETCSNPEDARAAALKKFRKEISKGYVDIFSGSYNGPVTIDSVKNYLEDDTEEPPLVANKKPEKRLKSKKSEEDFVVQCNDNTGIKDLFDQGANYIAKDSEEDDMIQVLDVYGTWQTCRANRFVPVKE